MRYEPATRVSLGPQPGALALQSYAAAQGFGSKGIYNPRNVRGGSSLSLHAEGRAVDLTHEGTDKTPEDVTDFCELLIAHHEALGVQQVIWWRRIWTVGKGWRAYTGQADHYDHAHIELTRHAAATLTVAALEAALTPEDEMLTPDQNDKLDQIYKAVYRRDYDGDGKLDTPYLMDAVMSLKDQVAALQSAVQVGGGSVDVNALAKAVADELHRRMAQ